MVRMPSNSNSCLPRRAQQPLTTASVDIDRPRKPKAKPWLPDHPPPSFTFINASLVDPVKGVVHSHATITTSSGIITSVCLDSVSQPAPTSSETNVIDLDGLYLCPGLIDCHVHLLATPSSFSLNTMFSASPSTVALRSTYTARTMLLRGFTTARDTGGADDSLKKAIAEFLVPGPRLFTCGKAMSQSGGHMDSRQPWEGEGVNPADSCCNGRGSTGLGVAVDGIPACLTQARENLRRGADFIKIATSGGVASASDPLSMVQFTGEEIRAIVSAADSLGTYVTAHAYTNAAIRHAVSNGVRGIEHANFIDAETAKWLAEKDVSVTPTLVTYQAMSEEPYSDFLDDVSKAKNEQVLSRGLESLRVLADAGVNVCFGTDLLAGMQAEQSREFEIRGAVVGAAKVLQSATVNAAKMLGAEGKLGVVEAGAFADLLVLGGNPLEDLGVLARPREGILAILKEGRVVTSRVGGLAVDEAYRGL